MSAQARRLGSVAVSALFFAAVTTINSAPASGSEKILHAFKGGTDGRTPQAGLTMDAQGDVFGTTLVGGGGAGCDYSDGCGTVFEISGRHTETVLHVFAGGCDGALPGGGLTSDGAGNLYGTTEIGGVCNSDAGYGTVFQLAPDGSETVLYPFQGTTDGEGPIGNLARDGNGNLFGTAEFGGNMSGCGGSGCGVVFEVTPSGTESVLHTFEGGQDGSQPSAGVIMDNSGSLFGTTDTGGGSGNCSGGCGTVFKIAPDGTVTILYTFKGGTDGWRPTSSLVLDSGGNLYGTTRAGGSADFGTVFEVTPNGSETILHSFQAGSDGNAPLAGLAMDDKRNLYGTTAYGGSNDCRHGGCGTVFEVTSKGDEKVLYAFLRGSDGFYPAAAPLLGAHGELYGTTTQGGGKGNNGVVFEMKK